MISKNGVAVAVFVLQGLLSSLGVEFEAGSVEKALEGVIMFMALALAVYNQVMRSDTKWFLFK
jgi:hypothetical protein